ncbi:hypothetical protein GCM10008955_00690 [Deinococcus malanensis]|uniref:Uncharacterized protein n=1 Tax=Deinococcus malanensis TaxID=1706855 RepID=A0ABQ2EH47_9DEIO|nr:hypothetical protein [Deinococcus malanensis]GGK11321.1 hypothetical protein GCM10008955_00690 [Deinococcus malanensis]
MKRVTFAGGGDLEVTLEPDFSMAEAGESGQVRLQAEGIDVETREMAATVVYGWYSPGEAREMARYLNEMADKAEQGVTA